MGHGKDSQVLDGSYQDLIGCHRISWDLVNVYNISRCPSRFLVGFPLSPKNPDIDKGENRMEAQEKVSVTSGCIDDAKTATYLCTDMYVYMHT